MTLLQACSLHPTRTALVLAIIACLCSQSKVLKIRTEAALQSSALLSVLNLLKETAYIDISTRNQPSLMQVYC